jgi:galactoside O-acetyltransferase
LTEFDGRRFAFAACGEDVTIYAWVRVLAPERIRIADHVIVDDFVFLDGGRATSIGSHVHIAAYTSIAGGGETEIGDFSGLSAGCRIVSGTDLMDGSGLTGPTIPEELRAVHRGRVVIGRHVVLGSNVVVHPDVRIGEGAIVGSGGVVLGDLEPWTINVGVPARAIKSRPREEVLRRAEALLGDDHS